MVPDPALGASASPKGPVFMYKAIFFDMDGTLLPMDLEEFMRGYFALIARFMAERGIDGEKVVDGIWKGTGAMFEFDGKTTNEERFWSFFPAYMENLGEKRDWVPLFDEFYEGRFAQLREKTVTNPLVAGVVETLHEKGYRLVLTTNPLFPERASRQRLSWTGADPSYFERVTAYENSLYAKPSPQYYAENLAACGLEPGEVLMVGNDTRDDAAAGRLGIDVYIVTDCLVQHEQGGTPLGELRHGTMEEFAAFVDALPALA